MNPKDEKYRECKLCDCRMAIPRCTVCMTEEIKLRCENCA